MGFTRINEMTFSQLNKHLVVKVICLLLYLQPANTRVERVGETRQEQFARAPYTNTHLVGPSRNRPLQPEFIGYGDLNSKHDNGGDYGRSKTGKYVKLTSDAASRTYTSKPNMYATNTRDVTAGSQAEYSRLPENNEYSFDSGVSNYGEQDQTPEDNFGMKSFMKNFELGYIDLDQDDDFDYGDSLEPPRYKHKPIAQGTSHAYPVKVGKTSYGAEQMPSVNGIRIPAHEHARESHIRRGPYTNYGTGFASSGFQFKPRYGDLPKSPNSIGYARHIPKENPYSFSNQRETRPKYSSPVPKGSYDYRKNSRHSSPLINRSARPSSRYPAPDVYIEKNSHYSPVGGGYSTSNSLNRGHPRTSSRFQPLQSFKSAASGQRSDVNQYGRQGQSYHPVSNGNRQYQDLSGGVCDSTGQNYNFCSSKKSGHYSHPRSIQCYIQCDEWGIAYVRPCAPGTYWAHAGSGPATANCCVSYESQGGTSGATYTPSPAPTYGIGQGYY